MRFTSLSALLLALVFALSACQRAPELFHERRILAFGTLIDVSLWGVDQTTADQAFQVLEADFSYMHDTWHAWRPSTLTRINDLLASGARFTAAPSVLPLIKLSTRLSDLSQGLFNPAIGRLIRLWGFQSDELPSTPPDPARIAELVKQHPRMDDIHVDGIFLQCGNPAVQLDFGGFAKGYGVDRAVERLRELGIDNGVVNAGGDLRAFGRRGDRPWRIGIRHPRQPGPIAYLDVKGDESIFTSGDYERYFEYQGHRYHHIIDPRTGYPATGSSSATVIYSDATTADAAATALFVAGPKDWPAISRSLGLDQVMLIATDGTVYMTPAMEARIHFTVSPPPPVIIRPVATSAG